MSAYNTTLLDEDDNEIYPKTLAENVYDGNTRMDQKVDGIRTDLGNPSSASAVTGADAFSKISKLNSDLTNLITYQDYDFDDISYTAGAVGSRGYQNAIYPQSTYKIVLSTQIIYIKDSSTVIPVVFYSKPSDAVYLNVYRSSTAAMSGNKITVRVTWLTPR